MFMINTGYRFPAPPVTADGLVLIPYGNYSERLFRTPLPEKDLQILDPQLYLAELNSESCSKVCSRLATYPWLGNNRAVECKDEFSTNKEWTDHIVEKISEFWPGVVTTDVDEACRKCIEFQQDLKCSHIIIPTPMLAEREDEASNLATWIDEGIKVASDLEIAQPILVSVAMNEAILNDSTFEQGGYLDAVVDQVVARDGIDGVYIVIAQTQVTHPFESNKIVWSAYAHLSRAFSEAGFKGIFINFADVFGLVCLALGASLCATGPSHSLRRLSPDSLKDGGGGTALPHLYSHKLMGELLSETDLKLITEQRLLTRVKDETASSRDLFGAIAAGKTAKHVPAWIESKNNISAAQSHFIERMHAEARSLRTLSHSERVDRIRDQLETASANALLLQSRLGEDGLPDHVAPSDKWLDILNRYT